MIDRIASGFHPFVLPFLAGMFFVFGYCIYGVIKILVQLQRADRLQASDVLRFTFIDKRQLIGLHHINNCRGDKVNCLNLVRRVSMLLSSEKMRVKNNFVP